MKYRIVFGKGPFEVFKYHVDEVVATNQLEAMKCSLRCVEKGGYEYEVLAEDGGNVFRGGHFLIRVSDERGVLCVIPATVVASETVGFPA